METVHILAPLRRIRTAAKEPAVIQKTRAQRSVKKKKKTPFPLLGHKFHFPSSLSSVETPSQPHLTAFDLSAFSLSSSSTEPFFSEPHSGCFLPPLVNVDRIRCPGGQLKGQSGFSIFFFLPNICPY